MITYSIEVKIKKVRRLFDIIFPPFLANDSKWFYSMYDDGRQYILLRVSERNLELEKELERMKYNFTQETYTKKNEKGVVRKHWELFVTCFHANSLLSMILSNTDKPASFERVAHMLANNLGLDYIHEARLLGILGLQRAYIAGRNEDMDTDISVLSYNYKGGR